MGKKLSVELNSASVHGVPGSNSVTISVRRPSDLGPEEFEGEVPSYSSSPHFSPRGILYNTPSQDGQLKGEVPSYHASPHLSQHGIYYTSDDIKDLQDDTGGPPVGKKPHFSLEAIIPGGEGERGEGAEKKELEEATSPRRGADRRWAYKNVLGIGFSFTFIFTAFLGLQNLQSSLNASGGLGLASLAVLYVFFTAFNFLSPSVIKILGTKYSLIAGYFCHLLYTFANFYPSWYTLIPTSMLLGVASALIWPAASSHLLQVAVIVAPKLQVDQNHLISVYMGTLFCFFQVAQIPGNLASSLILFPYGSNPNMTAADEVNSSGMGSCERSTDVGEFELKYLYILCSVYSISVLVGIVFAAALISGLDNRQAFFSSSHKFKHFLKEPLIEVLRVMKDIKMVLMVPVVVFSGLEQAFAFGTFTILIAKCFGTYQVGFTLITLGVSSAVSSIVCGKIVKYIPMLCVFFAGSVVNAALLLFLLLWSPFPSYPAIFLFAVFWGAADGVWNTLTTGLIGILFPTCPDAAYSVQRMWQALGFSLAFVLAELLELHAQAWFLLASVVLVTACNIGIEIVTHFQLPHLCHRSATQTPAASTDSS